MQFQRKHFFLIACLVAAIPMAADVGATGNKTCPTGTTGKYPDCKPTPPPTSGGSSNQQQDQSQHQGQGQGQGQVANGGAGGSGLGVATAVGHGGSATGGAGGQGGQGGLGGTGGSSRSNAAGGNATGGSVGDTSSSSSSSSGGNRLSNGSASESGASANGFVSVDASDRSSIHNSTRSNVFVPGDLPSNAMNIVAGSYITTAGDTECGVLVRKVQKPVYQWNKKGTKKREVGFTEDIEPYLDANGIAIDYQPVYTNDAKTEGYMRGSHVTYAFAGAGGSNSSQLGLQGYSAGGGGGLSFGSGSAYSQAGALLIVRPCIAFKFEPKPAVIKAKPRPVIKKKKAAPRARTSCQTVSQTVCPKGK